MENNKISIAFLIGLILSLVVSIIVNFNLHNVPDPTTGVPTQSFTAIPILFWILIGHSIGMAYVVIDLYLSK